MNLKLNRIFFHKNYTIGKLYINGQYWCDTLEDTNRDFNRDGDLLDEGEGKIYAETAIPFGIYKVEVTMSPRFKRYLPILIDVKHFSGIRIHSGNSAGDSSGCILVGLNKVKGRLVDSRIYENKLVKLLLEAQKKGDNITIEIC